MLANEESSRSVIYPKHILTSAKPYLLAGRLRLHNDPFLSIAGLRIALSLLELPDRAKIQRREPCANSNDYARVSTGQWNFYLGIRA